MSDNNFEEVSGPSASPKGRSVSLNPVDSSEDSLTPGQLHTSFKALGDEEKEGSKLAQLHQAIKNDADSARSLATTSMPTARPDWKNPQRGTGAAWRKHHASLGVGSDANISAEQGGDEIDTPPLILDKTTNHVMNMYNSDAAKLHERNAKVRIKRARMSVYAKATYQDEKNGCEACASTKERLKEEGKAYTLAHFKKNHPDVAAAANAAEQSQADVEASKPFEAVTAAEFVTNPTLMHHARVYELTQTLGRGPLNEALKPEHIRGYGSGRHTIPGTSGAKVLGGNVVVRTPAANPGKEDAWAWEVPSMSSLEKVAGAWAISRKAYKYATKRGKLVSDVMGSTKKYPTDEAKQRRISEIDAWGAKHTSAWGQIKTDIMKHVYRQGLRKAQAQDVAGTLPSEGMSKNPYVDEYRKIVSNKGADLAKILSETESDDAAPETRKRGKNNPMTGPIVEAANRIGADSGTIDPSSLPTTRVGISSPVSGGIPQGATRFPRRPATEVVTDEKGAERLTTQADAPKPVQAPKTERKAASGRAGNKTGKRKGAPKKKD